LKILKTFFEKVFKEFYISLISRQAVSRILFRQLAETIIYLALALPLGSSELLFITPQNAV